MDQPKLIGQRRRIRGNSAINFVGKRVMLLANLIGTPFGIAAGLDQVLRSIVHLVFVGFQLRLDFIESVT